MSETLELCHECQKAWTGRPSSRPDVNDKLAVLRAWFELLGKPVEIVYLVDRCECCGDQSPRPVERRPKSRSKSLWADADEELASWLEDRGYTDEEEWALDSDYVYDDNEDVWYDDDGNPVDLQEKLWYIIDSLEDQEN